MNAFQFACGRQQDPPAAPRPCTPIQRLLPALVTHMPRSTVAGGLLALLLGLLAWGAPVAQASQGPPQAGTAGRPAHTATTGGYEAAFQANTGMLWVVHNGVGRTSAWA